jgi:hypothetical protein
MVVSDDVIEYHASRIILLLYSCGIKDRESGFRRIDGLTKLAKLDFFARYPKFFARAANHEGTNISEPELARDSAMVRHHYGPWDHRYYHLLSYLESRGLLKVEKDSSINRYNFYLTNQGINIAEHLSERESFRDMVSHLDNVNSVFRNKSGNQLKELIYEIFDDEVADRSLGEIIE